MKKIISVIVIMALMISSFVFASAEDTAPADLYGTVYYETDFSEVLNTTDKTKPYWQLGSDAVINDGILTVSATSAFVFPAVATAKEGENIVLEANIRMNATTNASIGGIFVKAAGDASDKRSLKTHIYGQKFIVNDNGAAAVTSVIDTSAWYNIRFIYEASTGEWDILTNGKASVKNNKHTNTGYQTIGGGFHRWVLENNVSIDSMKIYSTKNVVQLDFDEEATNAEFCDYTVSATSGEVYLANEDGRDCLVVEQISNEETKVDIKIPGVYAANDNPYIVFEMKFKVDGGQNTTIGISGNQNGQHLLTNLRNYNNFLYVRDPASGASSAYKVKEGFSTSQWYDIKFVFDMSVANSTKYDVYVDGVLAQQNVPAVIVSADCINLISVMKPTGCAASKVFVDEVNVYNATEDIVAFFNVNGKTSYAEGEIGALTAEVKAIDGTILEKAVTYSLKDEYENVFVATNGDVSADFGVQPGFFTVVATMEANGVTYTKEIQMRVTSAKEAYKLISSSVDTTCASFELADLSADGAQLWSAIVIYESGDVLKDIIINQPSFENHVWKADISLDGIAAAGDTVKVFFWNNISAMKPYFAPLGN